LAAVHREIPVSAIGSTWRPALDLVWDFLGAHPGLWTGGHNVFVYRAGASGLLECDFGVEVTGAFEPAGAVRPIHTPEGEVALVIHRGPYNRLADAYEAIDGWMRDNRRESGGCTWEIYGDPMPDPAETETTVVRLLR
jgi:hypothetical protein